MSAALGPACLAVADSLTSGMCFSCPCHGQATSCAHYLGVENGWLPLLIRVQRNLLCSQTAQKVFFCGAFTSGGLKVWHAASICCAFSSRLCPALCYASHCCCLQVGLSQGKLHIHHEGRSKKFVARVQQKTFSVLTARRRDIYYLTERAVFKLVEGKGIELIEVAPGVDIQRDVLAQMDFKPIIRHVKQMDERVFQP